MCAGGGKGKARFGVISAASENPCCDEDSSWAYYQSQLIKYGAAEVYYIPVTVNTTENNDDPRVISQIRTLTGFFFGGGDQSRIITSFYNQDQRVPSPALMAIKETLLATGGVVAGTSAGTDVQTLNTMITGGSSYNGLLVGTQTYWQITDLPNENILTAYGPGGIGTFPYGLLDTHFANRGRHGRLIAMALDTSSHPVGSHICIGVDENTALVVTGPWDNRKGRVLGEGGVFLADMSDADASAPALGTYRQIRQVRASRLSSGDMLDMLTMRITFASYKESMTTKEQDVLPVTSKNIFGEYLFEWDTVVQSLFLSTHSSARGLTLQSHPTAFQVMFRKRSTTHQNRLDGIEEKHCSAEGFDGVDPSSGLYAYGYQCLWIDIIPVE